MEKQDPEVEARRRKRSLESYHKSFRENPEAMRERRRQYRKVHAAQINRNQRRYRKENAAELNRKRRENRRLQAERSAEISPSRAPTAFTPEESARSWQARRQTAGPERSAEQSAEAWKSRGQQQRAGPTAEEAVRNWLARQQGRGVPEAGRTAEERSPRNPQPGTTREADEEDVRKPVRHRDHDLEF